MRERQDWKVLETDKVATVPSGIGVSMQYKHLLLTSLYIQGLCRCKHPVFWMWRRYELQINILSGTSFICLLPPGKPDNLKKWSYNWKT